jgi:hypothetical protein
MDGYSAFLIALNNSVMGGNFKSASGEQVRFAPDGTVKGLKGYDKYELCTGGDCVVMQNLDVITMKDSGKPDSQQMFGYRFSAAKDSLLIYNLINNNPAEKGNYSQGAVVHTLLKQGVKPAKPVPPAQQPAKPSK